jgi:hypothetical protein
MRRETLATTACTWPADSVPSAHAVWVRGRARRRLAIEVVRPASRLVMRASWRSHAVIDVAWSIS